MISFLVWLGLGWSLGGLVGSLILGRNEELDDITFNNQMFALLCVLTGLFA